QFMWQLAYALGQEERDKEAQHFYQLAYESMRDNVDFLKDYYYYLIEIGQIELAKSILQLLLQKDSGNPEWDAEQGRLQ
ncbi:hypothetical protein WL285_13030, partial [Staphylococcus warneri]